MVFHRPILGVTLGMQSLALAGRAIQTIPKELRGGPVRVRRVGKVRVRRNPFKARGRRMKVSPSPIIRGGVEIMTGTALLGPTATIAAAVP